MHRVRVVAAAHRRRAHPRVDPAARRRDREGIALAQRSGRQQSDHSDLSTIHKHRKTRRRQDSIDRPVRVRKRITAPGSRCPPPAHRHKRVSMTGPLRESSRTDSILRGYRHTRATKSRTPIPNPWTRDRRTTRGTGSLTLPRAQPWRCCFLRPNGRQKRALGATRMAAFGHERTRLIVGAHGCSARRAIVRRQPHRRSAGNYERRQASAASDGSDRPLRARGLGQLMRTTAPHQPSPQEPRAAGSAHHRPPSSS